MKCGFQKKDSVGNILYSSLVGMVVCLVRILQWVVS
jgi:hypothetical protein